MKDHFGESNKMVDDLTKENEELKKELAALKAEMDRLKDKRLVNSVNVIGLESSQVIDALRQERDAYRGAVREARGSLGYGPLETMPSTIKVVRDILDNVIAAYPKKEEK